MVGRGKPTSSAACIPMEIMSSVLYLQKRALRPTKVLSVSVKLDKSWSNAQYTEWIQSENN